MDVLSSLRWLAVLLCVAVGPAARALTLYVAPNGIDTADGLAPSASGTHGPLGSIQAALVRMGERAGDPGDAETSDRILLLPGRYVLQSTVLVGPDSRGQSSKPIVIAAQEIGTVVLSGGSRLPTFQRNGDRWRARLAESTDVTDLWIGDRRATLARAPNEEWFQGGRNTSRPVREDPPLRVSQPATIDNTRRLVVAEPAQALLRELFAQPASPPSGLRFVALHSWAGSRQLVDAYDAATGTVTLSPNGRWPFLLFDRNQRYRLENHPALLDAPGEWWAAPDGTVDYVPRMGEVPSDFIGVVPRLETLLRVTGSANQPIRRVVVRGIRFQHARAIPAPHVDGQAATSVPAAVVADYVQGLEIDQCAFEHLGGHALWFRNGVIDSRVRRSHFRDLGAGGIRIGEARVPAEDADTTARVTVEDNLIENGGITFPAAVGIWVGQSGNNRILHNEVRDFDYSGISVGWNWSFKPSPAQRNLIEKNHLHDLGRGVLNDMGGVYTLGPSAGTVIRNNLIERVISWRQTGGSTAFGIYLDASSSDILVENNVSIGSTGGGFHLHWGRDNLVRNNVFVDGELAQAKRVRSGPDARLRFEQNVLVGDSPLIYQGEWSDSDIITRRNVLWRRGQPFELRGRDLATLQSLGFEAGTVEADPQLKCDRAHCAVSSAVAQRTGFSPISLQDVGVRERGSMLPR